MDLRDGPYFPIVTEMRRCVNSPSQHHRRDSTQRGVVERSYSLRAGH